LLIVGDSKIDSITIASRIIINANSMKLSLPRLDGYFAIAFTVAPFPIGVSPEAHSQWRQYTIGGDGVPSCTRWRGGLQ
jgi:hypothetical protein